MIRRDCNKCTCRDGSWECTQQACDAICEGNGDPHYRTFDGKNYDFMGDCRYYLVSSPTITIIVENRKCGTKMSCTKSLRIIVGSTDIKLLPGNCDCVRRCAWCFFFLLFLRCLIFCLWFL